MDLRLPVNSDAPLAMPEERYTISRPHICEKTSTTRLKSVGSFEPRRALKVKGLKPLATRLRRSVLRTQTVDIFTPQYTGTFSKAFLAFLLCMLYGALMLLTMTGVASAASPGAAGQQPASTTNAGFTASPNKNAVKNRGAAARGNAAANGDRYAVLVGVNDYEGSAPTLHYAVPDARRLYNTLIDPKVCNMPKDHIALLTSEETDGNNKPTAANIVRVVKDMAHRAKKGDQFWFYFAGHGIEFHKLSYLLPQKFVCANLDKTALSTHMLRDMLDKECKASEKVIILDACQSGSARGLDTAPTLQQTLNAAGMITLSACSINESAWELSDFHDGSGGGGVFTFYLVNGLKKYADANHDGNVSVVEIKDYVITNVEQEIQKEKQVSQTPQFIANDSGNLATVFLSRTIDAATGDLPPVLEMPDLEVKKPLPPALIVLLDPAPGIVGKGGPANPVENAVIKRLLKKGFLIADTDAANVLHKITGDQAQAAQAAGKRGARFLAIGQFTTDAKSVVPPLTTVTVSISVRLVDEKGNVLATATGVSDPHAGTTETAAEAEAIDDAADKFVDDLSKSGIKKALGLN